MIRIESDNSVHPPIGHPQLAWFAIVIAGRVVAGLASRGPKRVALKGTRLPITAPLTVGVSHGVPLFYR